MTILTKSSDKNKLLPIGTFKQPINHVQIPVESETAHRAREKTTTVLVCLMAFLVLLAGILAGICFYRQYLQDKIHRFNAFIPYDDREVDAAENNWASSWRDGPTFNDQDENISDDSVEMNQRIRNLLRALFTSREFEKPLKDVRTLESEIQEKFFREDIEIQDDEEDSYADIKIPDFKDGRRGRFIHDYKNNQTTIVDEDANRCFIYPLDYETTMPPKSIIDVFTKMQTGYYFPDTIRLNKKMRVMLPPINIRDDYVSARTAAACTNKRIYKMEPIVSGVFRRSVPEPLDDQSKFAEFAGKIVQYDIINMSEVREYEKD